MPWNDNANSGQKPPGKPDKPGSKPNPWGDTGSGSGPEPKTPPRHSGPARKPPGGSGGGGGGGSAPPDLNDISAQVTARLKSYFGNGRGGGDAGKKAALAVGGGIIGLWLLSGVYTVGANERAVITTLGAYSGDAGPGLNYRLPWPVQKVEKVPFTTLNRTEIGGAEGASIPEESLMLTRDENIVDLHFTVQWRVDNARSYVFNLKDRGDAAIKAVAESAMREVVGRTDLQPIITNGQSEVGRETAKLMQGVLNSYNAGIFVDDVQIKSASLPTEVLDSFREVAAAKQDAEQTINRARGKAAQIRQEALGYKAQTVQEAEGEAARFNQVYVQYKAAPAVTRQRLYIETMEKVLRQSNMVVIDSKGASAPIVLSPNAFMPKTAPSEAAGGR